VIDTPYLAENKIETYRVAIENKILVKPTEFAIEQPFERDWYTNSEKFLKTKLGRLSTCKFK
jgi:hypothetical protein